MSYVPTFFSRLFWFVGALGFAYAYDVYDYTFLAILAGLCAYRLYHMDMFDTTFSATNHALHKFDQQVQIDVAEAHFEELMQGTDATTLTSDTFSSLLKGRRP